MTNASGLFTLPGLRPGDYMVVIELAGFNRFVRTGTTLQVAQVVRIDARLQTGNVTEAVEPRGNRVRLAEETTIER